MRGGDCEGREEGTEKRFLTSWWRDGMEYRTWPSGRKLGLGEAVEESQLLAIEIEELNYL